MRIGVFTDSFKPYISGVVRSIETFSQELTDLGHDVYIFGPSYLGCKPEERVFRFIGIPSPTKPDFTLPIPFSWHLRHKMRELDIDLIHVHSPFLLGRLGAKAARILGFPLVFTYHTFYEQYVHYLPFGHYFSRKVIKSISREFCNRCNLVIVPSSAGEMYLRGIGVHAPLKIIPTGINLRDFKVTETSYLRSRFSISRDTRILLFVGRIGAEKNLLFLIKAFDKVRQLDNNVKLILVGSGPQEEYLKKVTVTEGLDNDVIFTGALDYKNVINSYFDADIFVFPSLTETQGLVIMEAKAAGLPVVAVNARGVRDMVYDKEDGFLTPHGVEQFCGAVLKLLKDRELYCQMSARAEINAQILSSRSCALKLLDAYEDVVFGNISSEGVGGIGSCN